MTRCAWLRTWMGPGCLALVLTACRSPAPVPDVASSVIAPSAPAASERPRSTSFIPEAPLVSRGKRFVGSSAVRYQDARLAGDGDPQTAWNAGTPSESAPAWLAIDIGNGPTRLLLQWKAMGSFNYEETDYGSPGSYRLEVSPDSTDGADGTWKQVASVSQVTTHSRTHEVPFLGQRWVRLVVTGAPSPSPNGVQIDTVDVYDASNGTSDTWFFMGDSITATAFGRRTSKEPGFEGYVADKHPHHAPLVVCGGVGGEKSEDGARHIDDWLRDNPDAKFWAIEYGTNDSAGDNPDTSPFEKALAKILDRVQADGRIPIVATIPYSTDGQHRTIPAFNRVIAREEARRGLLRGPDFYAWFEAHPEELRDGLHPNDKGIASINRLWSEAVDELYRRGK